MEYIGPNFLGIGAHKAGSSWLYYQLKRHPRIWMSPEKELNFFNRSQNSFFNRSQNPQKSQGLATVSVPDDGESTLEEQEYCNVFLPGMSAKIRGEITPTYSVLPSEDVARIKRLNPEMKLIFSIRNPIDRAWSAIRYNVHRGKMDVNLDSSDEIIAALNKRGVVLRGDYERTLQTYLEHFDSQQILVCFYDAIQDNPEGLMTRITSWLGVEPLKKSQLKHKTYVNVSPRSPMPPEVKTYLQARYQPLMSRLAEKLGSYAITWTGDKPQDNISVEGINHSLPPATHP
jgi:hypothetical protein